MAEPIVSRVYDLKVVGYDNSLKQVQSLTDAFTKMDAAKTKLNAKLQQKTSSGDTGAVQQLTARIKELETEMQKLSTQKQSIAEDAAAETSATNVSSQAYTNLVKSYKEARANAQEMAAQFGVESEQAKAASVSLLAYKTQLNEINNLVKTGGATKATPAATAAATPVSTLTPEQIARPTDNLDALEAERLSLKKTGTVVNELDKAQAEADITAQQWAASQKKVAEDVGTTGTVVDGIKGSLDQYTGTLRQNITAQIENAQALAANKEQQQAIQREISLSGTASESQIASLAKLKEQQLVLTETNKALTVTIRNQAKEFIASEGSMDELQAKVNQLQQAYEQLSEAERASPFGQGIKAEIDVLEPKIKDLEGTIGKFQRNVGNYPTVFSGAFKTLENEIDTIQGKLVQGNFSGKELDELTAKQTVLQKATGLVSKEFSTSAAQANAYKQAATEIGLVYGKNSNLFQQFSEQVKTGSTTIQGLATEVSTVTSKGAGFSKFLTTAYNGLRRIAYVIPGLGIGGLVLLLLGPLQAAGAAVYKSLTKTEEAISGLSAEALKQIQAFKDATKDVNEEYIKNSTVAVSKLEQLRSVITDTTKTEKERVAALKDYNKIADANNKIDVTQLNNLNLINDSISKQIDLVEKRALGAANEKLLTDAAIKLQLAQEEARAKATELIDKTAINTGKDKTPDNYFTQLERQAAIDQEIAKDQAVKDAQATFDALKKVSADFNLKNGYIPDPQTTLTKTTGSKLDQAEKEAIKLIEANRDRLLAIENTSVNDIQKVRELSFQEEKAHLIRVEQIEVDALNQKIALLNKKKNLNAEEKKQLAQFEEQKSTIELQTSQKINDLLQKDFDKRAKLFKENLDRQIANAKAVNQQIQDNPDLSPSQKAKGQVDEDNAILKAQVAFFLQMDYLEKAYNKTSKKNAEDRARDISTTHNSINKDTKAFAVAILADIDKQTDIDVTNIKLKYDKLVQDILKSKQSIQNKTVAIKILTTTQNVETGGSQLKGDVAKVLAAKQLLDFGLITKKQFEDIYAAANEGQIKLNEAIKAGEESITSFGALANKSLGKLFGFADGSGQSQLLAQTITAGFDTAKNAMESYFQAEANNIQHSNDITQKRLDIELQQAKTRAQSQAEQDSLDRQFQAKKDAANKEAFEKNKKLQIEQAKINLAIQLSNLAVIAFAPNPLNIATLGIAGTIMYAVQAALALANYALNVSKINSAQYAGGGLVKPAKPGNGRITVAPNIPTQRNGDNVFATVKTNEVILNEEQQRKLGGPATFRAIGVPGFAAGGFTGGLDSAIGTKWNMAQAPIDPGSYLNPGRNYSGSDKTDEKINKLAVLIAETSRQTNQRIDKFQVLLDPNAVLKANNKTKKATAIGTL